MAGTSKSGRRKQPHEIAVLKGNFRADRNKPPLDCGGGRPRRPADLDPIADRFWTEIVEKLIRRKIIKAVDAPQAAMMARLWSLACRTMQAASENPLDKDSRIASLAYLKSFDHVASAFGLSPADRSRIGSIGDKPSKGIPSRQRSRGQGKRGSLFA